jgi:CO/xanthine dehydrogenase Mo-binding subunit
MDLKEVGKRRPRLDAVEQVTGQKKYVEDLYLRRILHAKGLLSTEYHARILKLDTTRASRLPGVRAIITGGDFRYNRFGIEVEDQPVLAEGKVRYKGEPIAVVAAETEEIAREAVSLIEVKYERLPAVFDAREAMSSKAPILHEEGQGVYCTGNVFLYQGRDHLMLRRGDVEKGFAESDLVIEDSFATSPQKPASIENHVALARPDGADKVTIWCSNQQVFTNAPQCAKALQMPLSKVRMISPAVGGGFGGKNDLTVEPMVALLALKTMRPVRWALTAEEDFLYATTKHAMYLTYKVGVKKDGTLVAMKRETITDAGAYRTYGLNKTKKSTYIGSGPYRIPNHWVDASVVYTNKQPSGSFRGFGMSQPTFAHEVMMDIVAEKIGMDPLLLRLKNCLVDGDRLPTGQAVRGVGVKDILEKLAEISKWEFKH